MRPILKISALFVVLSFGAAGCATTRPRQADSSDLSSRVAQLEKQLAEKERQLQDLEYQMDGKTNALRSGVSAAPRPSSVIRVPGVTIQDVQKALVKAGLDPGPVDGRLGKKTKAAIKEFQRTKRLKADGIVGEKTWALLKA